MLRHLPRQNDPRLLVGLETSDDAAVYQLTSELALIVTVDFFTPVVDDPYLFGQIAAANALSDIYAMGGQPLLALNIVCFPTCLPQEVMAEILRGGADKVREAGAIIAGGHTVEDNEPKYGLAVTGLVHPQRVITNAGASPGDVLVLTKPLGTGIITTAVKAGLAPQEAYEAAVETMCSLNREAAEAMQAAKVRACTDITGFGLLGHAAEMAGASGVSLVFEYARIPLLPRVLELAATGLIPGGAYRNRDHLASKVAFALSLTPAQQAVLFDPQTSGGLLIAVSPDRLEQLLEELTVKGVSQARVVGRVIEKQDWLIRIE